MTNDPGTAGHSGNGGSGKGRAGEKAPAERHVGRRTFLKVTARATFLLGLGGVVTLWQRNHFLRPPGASAEARFLSLCIKCHRCQQICPTGVIVPVLLTDDLRSAGTPQLNFRVGECTLCLECVLTCPTGALEHIPQEEVRLGLAVIDRAKCIAWSWLGCTLCLKECPQSAIELDELNRPIVNASKCNGCGRCEYVCIASLARSYGRGGGKGIVVMPLDLAQAGPAAEQPG